jgi:hypothetical protein
MGDAAINQPPEGEREREPDHRKKGKTEELA